MTKADYMQKALDLLGSGDVQLNIATTLEALDKAEAERDALREAVRAAIVWHDEQDKSISKQPNANAGNNGWMRHQHQEQRDLLSAALGQAEAIQPEPDPLDAVLESLPANFAHCVDGADVLREALARHGLAVKEVTRHD